ncbi:MAG: T9SS type A sorting domain-containing protein [Bacteroidetes bacterium]|nr:T9SS type A sorting domain-containing protein [Bacteroidota bacterium]
MSSTGGEAICEDSAGNLYVGNVNGLRKSTDGGETWSSTPLADYHRVCALATLASGEIFAGVEPLDPSLPGGVYRTSDGGTSWSSLGLQEWTVCSVLPIDATRLYSGSARGVFRSTDGGATWQHANGGIAETHIKSLLCVDSLTVLAGTDVGVFRSNDNGEMWIESSEGIFPQIITCLMQDHQKNLFAGTSLFSPNGGVFKSTDGGLSWRCSSQDSIKGMYGTVHSLAATKQNTLLASVDWGNIYRSTDEGETWTLMKRFTTRRVADIAADSAGPVYGATGGDGVILSLDDGLTWWVNPNPGLPNRSINCVVARAAHEVFAGALWGVARSTDAGGSWTQASSLPGGSEVVALSVDRQGDVLASTYAGGVFRSTDDGLSWLPDSAGLSGHKVHAFASAGGMTFATDSGRIYRRMSRPLDVSPTDGRMPARISLAQNYPNPFNPSTTIKYELPGSYMVRLSVYDVLGREVSVLVDERREAGIHEVQFEGSGLSSGVYLCRLTAGRFVETRKLVLVR